MPELRGRLTDAAKRQMGFARLRKYSRPRCLRGHLDDLPWEVAQRAREWLDYFLERYRRRRGYNPPQWLKAIYFGLARRLAKNPPNSQWGNSMFHRKGGYAVQRRYLWEGRNPTATARAVREGKRQLRRKAEERQRLGLPPPARVRFLDSEGI